MLCVKIWPLRVQTGFYLVDPRKCFRAHGTVTCYSPVHQAIPKVINARRLKYLTTTGPMPCRLESQRNTCIQTSWTSEEFLRSKGHKEDLMVAFRVGVSWGTGSTHPGRWGRVRGRLRDNVSASHPSLYKVNWANESSRNIPCPATRSLQWCFKEKLDRRPKKNRFVATPKHLPIPLCGSFSW